MNTYRRSLSLRTTYFFTLLRANELIAQDIGLEHITKLLQIDRCQRRIGGLDVVKAAPPFAFLWLGT